VLSRMLNYYRFQLLLCCGRRKKKLLRFFFTKHSTRLSDATDLLRLVLNAAVINHKKVMHKCNLRNHDWCICELTNYTHQLQGLRERSRKRVFGHKKAPKTLVLLHKFAYFLGPYTPGPWLPTPRFLASENIKCLQYR